MLEATSPTVEERTQNIETRQEKARKGLGWGGGELDHRREHDCVCVCAHLYFLALSLKGLRREDTFVAISTPSTQGPGKGTRDPLTDSSFQGQGKEGTTRCAWNLSFGQRMRRHSKSPRGHGDQAQEVANRGFQLPNPPQLQHQYPQK